MKNQTLRVLFIVFTLIFDKTTFLLLYRHLLSDYEHVGQNLGFTNSSVAETDIVKSIKELILLWYDEVALFDNSWINDTQDRGIKVGHYTQLVWAETSEIGCAATYYSSLGEKRKWYHILFVCNYGPGGNYISRPVYKTGKPCSRCPKGLKQNRKYKGLCGTIRNLNETESFTTNGLFEAVGLNEN